MAVIITASMWLLFVPDVAAGQLPCLVVAHWVVAASQFPPPLVAPWVVAAGQLPCFAAAPRVAAAGQLPHPVVLWIAAAGQLSHPVALWVAAAGQLPSSLLRYPGLWPLANYLLATVPFVATIRPFTFW